MKTTAVIDTYKFDDMTIRVIVDPKGAEVYKEVDTGLLFCFGVTAEGVKELDIEALHENGYFDQEAEDGEPTI